MLVQSMPESADPFVERRRNSAYRPCRRVNIPAMTTSTYPRRLANYAAGEWVTGSGTPTDLFHAVTGDKVAEASTNGIDYGGMVEL